MKESEFGIDCGFTCLMFGLVISFSVGFFSTLLMSFPVQERVNGVRKVTRNVNASMKKLFWYVLDETTPIYVRRLSLDLLVCYLLLPFSPLCHFECWCGWNFPVGL